MDAKQEQREMARVWWLPVLIGIAWLLYANVVLSMSLSTVWSVAVVTGISFIGGGITSLAMASMSKSGRGWLITFGIISIIGGVLALAWPASTYLVLARIFAWTLLFRGSIDLVTSMSSRDENDFWWLQLLMAIVEILVAFSAVRFVTNSLFLLAIWVGVSAIAHGITNIVLGFQLRKIGKGNEQVTAAAA